MAEYRKLKELSGILKEIYEDKSHFWLPNLWVIYDPFKNELYLVESWLMVSFEHTILGLL
jgi:hypothetical protein